MFTETIFRGENIFRYKQENKPKQSKSSFVKKTLTNAKLKHAFKSGAASNKVSVAHQKPSKG